MGIIAVLILSAGAFWGVGPLLGVDKAKTSSCKIIKKKAERMDLFWARARQEVDKSPGEILAQQSYETSKGLWYTKLIKGNASIPTVALTFDDGPHPKFTPQLLAILKKYKIKATFFVVGEMAGKHPNLLRLKSVVYRSAGSATTFFRRAIEPEKSDQPVRLIHRRPRTERLLRRAAWWPAQAIVCRKQSRVPKNHDASYLLLVRDVDCR